MYNIYTTIKIYRVFRCGKMTVFLEVSLATILAGLLVWMWSISKSNSKYLKNIPSPPGWPILGHALELRSSHKILNVFMDYCKYGTFVKVCIGPARTVLFTTDYNFLEFVLGSTKLLNKSLEYRHSKAWLGTGLLTSDGPKWKKHRKILTPAFHFQILEQFIDVFESCGSIMVNKFKKVSGETSIDIYSYITLCTLDIICETAMGTSVNAQQNENSIYVQSVNEISKIMLERASSPIQMHDFLFPLTNNYYAQKRALKVIHSYSHSVIANRKQEKIKENLNPSDENSENCIGLKKRKVFLDVLLESTVDGRPFTDEEIREEVDTFMFEGHDTTASAISFTLFALANHKDIQDKVLAEQELLFGKNKDPVMTYSDLQNMKYLDLVIKESLRLYPSVPLYARETTEDIEYNGTLIPKGIAICMFDFGLHRNPDLFENPETFNPERFTKMDNKKSPYIYVPFSAGPRNCIGQKFAMLEMKSTISKVIRNFELFSAIPSHTLQLVPETVLKSANGVRIGLKTRN